MPTVDQWRRGFTSRPASVTSTVDGRNHLVGDEPAVAGQVAGQGAYVALCGHRVLAAPLVVPPGPTCFDCETALHRTTTVTAQHRDRLVLRLLRRRRA
jgi:hypothetical protein